MTQQLFKILHEKRHIRIVMAQAGYLKDSLILKSKIDVSMSQKNAKSDIYKYLKASPLTNVAFASGWTKQSGSKLLLVVNKNISSRWQHKYYRNT